jgi:hypothetical protein
MLFRDVTVCAIYYGYGLKSSQLTEHVYIYIYINKPRQSVQTQNTACT